jgi:hypothetical protein
LKIGSPDGAGFCAPHSSPARVNLCNAIKSLEAASTELIEAQVAGQRLVAIVRELETAENELAASRAEDERSLGTWLAGGADGERPQPSARTLAAERAVAALARDAVAARSALPEYEAKVQLCAERVRDLGIARRDVAYRVAVEAVREFLDTEFRPAIQRLLASEAKAWSVERALRDLGNGADPSFVALGCSVEVAEAIRAAKFAERGPHDHETGKRLIDRLMTNAEVTFEEDRQRD